MKLDALLNPTDSNISHHHHHRHQPSSSSSTSSFSHIDNHTRLPPPHRSSTSSHDSSPPRSPSYSCVPHLDRSNSSESGHSSASPISTPLQESFDFHARAAPKHLTHFPPPPTLQNITLPAVRPHIAHLRSSSSLFGTRYPPMAQLPNDPSFPGTPHSATHSDLGFPSAPLGAYATAPMTPQSATPLAPGYMAQPPLMPLAQQPLPQPGQHPMLYPQPPVGTATKSTKKNSYPCPVAKQFNCNEFFTTSGHAARHAKKHTGKKDAICPECGKAFTRKDNMEQHRRTHNGNRSNSKANAAKRETSEEAQARRARQQRRKARPSSISTSATASPLTGGPEFALLDPALRGSPQDPLFSVAEDPMVQFPNPGLLPQQPMTAPSSTITRSDLQQTASAVQALHARQSSQAASASFPSPPAGSSPSAAPALDALALAASQSQNGGQ